MAEEIRKATAAERNWLSSSLVQLRALYQRRHQDIHYLRRLRFMRLRSQAPRPFQRVVQHGLQSPFSFNLVQNVVGMLTRERPSFERLPRNDTRREREAAERLQRSADPLLQTFEAIARKPLLALFFDHLVADGEAVARIGLHRWSGFPVREPGEDDASYNRRVAKFLVSSPAFPMRLRILDPLTVLRPMETGDDEESSYVIEAGQRPLVPTLRALGLRPTSSREFAPDERVLGGERLSWWELPAGMPATVEVVEAWTPEWCFVSLGGDQVFAYPNRLGFVPYVWVSGVSTGVADPELSSLSLLYPLQGVEPWLSTLLSTMAAWAILGGTPILWTSRQPYAGAPPPDAPAQVSEIPLGKRIDLGTGGQIGFAQPPPVGREVLEFLNTLISILDRSGLAPVAQGLMTSRTPGTAYNAAVEMALARLNPLVRNAEYGIADIVRMAWKVVERVLGVPVWVTGADFAERERGRRTPPARYVIDPADIDGYYDLTCTVKITSLQDQIARGTHAAFMRAHQLWSRERAMKFSGVDEPWEEFRRVLANRVEESPFAIQQVIREIVQQDEGLRAQASELEQQGIDMVELISGALGAGTEPAPPQPRGGPAPRAGGRPRGSPKNPGGPRRAPQGSRGPTFRY